MLLDYFPRWEKTIGELASISIRDFLLFRDLTLYQWTGFGLMAAPVLFYLRYREDKRALPMSVMVLAVFGLTLWQVRWGYFFGIVFAMSLPFQFAVFRKTWIVWVVFILSLEPVCQGWGAGMLSGKARADAIDRTRDALALRVVSEYLKTGELLPVLAPWWFCPPIAYWSEQPTVAGTSHESMPGIVDASRFYLTTDYEEGMKILRKRGVKRVIAYDPDRVLQTSSVLLNEPADGDKAARRGPLPQPVLRPSFFEI